jgi:4a-hydroxytetrahydrobiopterin dehydratase
MQTPRNKNRSKMADQKLNTADIQNGMKQIPRWKRKGKEIGRQYRFADFVKAMAFVKHVATLAQKLDHHPDITVQYNKVQLTLSTHSSGGLTDLDFIFAQQIDKSKGWRTVLG